MLCWTSGFFVGFYNLFKEQIEYNHKVPYRNNRQCLG